MAVKFYDAVAVVVAVEKAWFLSHLQRLAVVKVRLVKQGRKALRPYENHNRCGERMGYILEEHFVTLWRGWR